MLGMPLGMPGVNEAEDVGRDLLAATSKNRKTNDCWLVDSPLKNMKAKWDHYSQYMGMIRGYDSHNSNILPLLKSARIKKRQSHMEK